MMLHIQMLKYSCLRSLIQESKLDALRFDELEKSFAVSAHVAVDFG